jgi:hypothetical protein
MHGTMNVKKRIIISMKWFKILIQVILINMMTVTPVKNVRNTTVLQKKCDWIKC